MKKFCLLLVCLLILPMFFVGCNKANKNYHNLINSIIELQENSENLYNEQIYIEGIKISNGGYKENGGNINKWSVRLEELIVTNNSIIQSYSSSTYYYFLFCDILTISDLEGNIIWARD